MLRPRRCSRFEARGWRAEFDIPFAGLHFVDRPDFDSVVDRLVLVDATTGRRQGEVEVGFELIFVG